MQDSPYQQKYVTFIDMLGFSSLVRASSDDSEKQKAIVEAIERLRDTACTNPATGTVITYFSDCLVISSNRTPAGLLAILRSIIIIAENLLVVDVMVRGGLAAGSIFHDGQFMFGPAMLEAYDLERLHAKHPMILVSAAVRAEIEAAGCAELLVHDDVEPERYYVHYLISFSRYDPKPRSGLLILDGPAQLVRHFIAQRLACSEGSVRQKAEWLERYWNETVAPSGFLPSVDRVADLQRPDAQPFRTRLAIWADAAVSGPEESTNHS